MLKKLLITGCTVFIMSLNVFAEPSNDELMAEIQKLKAKITQQENKISDLEGRLYKSECCLQDMVAKKDVNVLIDERILAREGTFKPLGDNMSFGLGITSVIQGTHNANADELSNKGDNSTDASYSVDMEFEKEFEDYGKAYVHFETGEGVGAEDELKVFSNVNRDSNDMDDALKLTEMWYEHYFKAVPISLMAGKIDPTILIDSNDYANDETTQFLGRIFRNSPVIEFPDNSPGLRVKLEPFEKIDLKLLAVDGDNDWEEIADNAFIAGELNLKPNMLKRKGNYRFISWMNDRNHFKWGDDSEAGYGYGFGISFDQELNDKLGVFCRYGWQEPDKYLDGASFSLEQAWSIGAQLAGNAWNRKDDILGIAIGQAIPSSRYKKAGTNLTSEDEGHFETYYNYKVNEHLMVGPDLQLITNPYGKDAGNGQSTITVVGMRGQLDF